MHRIAEANEQRPLERLLLDQLELVARRDPPLGQETQHLRVRIRHPDERAPLARLELIQTLTRHVGDRELAIGDRIAVRIEGRVAELDGDRLLQLLRDDVLEPFRLRVDLIPAHAQALGQIQLEQAMMAQHLQRHPPARLGQAHAAIALVHDQAERVELAQHPRHRPRPHPQPLRQRIRRRHPGAAFQRVDRLRVVLDRRGEVGLLNHLCRHA